MPRHVRAERGRVERQELAGRHRHGPAARLPPDPERGLAEPLLRAELGVLLVGPARVVPQRPGDDEVHGAGLLAGGEELLGDDQRPLLHGGVADVHQAPLAELVEVVEDRVGHEHRAVDLPVQLHPQAVGQHLEDGQVVLVQALPGVEVVRAEERHDVRAQAHRDPVLHHVALDVPGLPEPLLPLLLEVRHRGRHAAHERREHAHGRHDHENGEDPLVGVRGVDLHGRRHELRERPVQRREVGVAGVPPVEPRYPGHRLQAPHREPAAGDVVADERDDGERPPDAQGGRQHLGLDVVREVREAGDLHDPDQAREAEDPRHAADLARPGHAEDVEATGRGDERGAVHEEHAEVQHEGFPRVPPRDLRRPHLQEAQVVVAADE
mmetsp:Transcript_91094/g.257921  ORF Transcript_91094/g.257921 Transcript_91094/m.257921 type:complete len:381 (+) Transcript_91094:552-1694(+)